MGNASRLMSLALIPSLTVPEVILSSQESSTGSILVLPSSIVTLSSVPSPVILFWITGAARSIVTV